MPAEPKLALIYTICCEYFPKQIWSACVVEHLLVQAVDENAQIA